MTRNLRFKFIVIGSQGVGKTSILKRLVDSSYNDAVPQTVGVEFETASMMIDGRMVNLQIWDTSGQERYRSITKGYYRNAVGVLLVFDITDRHSFDDCPSWLADISTLCDANAVVQLIGNKSDLVAQRTVTIAEAEAFASHQRLLYLETSAKAGANVTEAFTRVAAGLVNRSYRRMDAMDTNPLLSDPSAAPPRAGCC
jgi:small GTP-binding protein